MTDDPASYEYQVEHNNERVEKLFEQIFPGVSVPYAYIYQIVSFLQETNVNPQALPRIIRGIHNITLGTGEGEVVVHVRKQTTTIEVKERDGEIKTKNL